MESPRDSQEGGNTKSEKRSFRSALLHSSASGLAAFISLCLLYVLSCGPAAWLYTHGYLSDRAIEIFSMPLGWARDFCSPFNRLMDWYIELWT